MDQEWMCDTLLDIDRDDEKVVSIRSAFIDSSVIIDLDLFLSLHMPRQIFPAGTHKPI